MRPGTRRSRNYAGEGFLQNRSCARRRNDETMSDWISGIPKKSCEYWLWCRSRLKPARGYVLIVNKQAEVTISCGMGSDTFSSNKKLSCGNVPWPFTHYAVVKPPPLPK